MSNPWGKIGNWALEAELAEAEEEKERAAQAQAPALAGAALPQSFPSLSEAASSKPKKKKPVPIPLTQFVTSAVGSPSADELLRLPTRPRDRAPDEPLDFGRRGFSSSSSSYSGGPHSRRGGGGFDDDMRRGPPSMMREDMPSRADEADNWAAGKRQQQQQGFARLDRGGGRAQDRYGSSSLGVGGGSRADEVDNWAAGKKPLQAQGFGSGFRSSSFGATGGGGLSSSDSDRWVRGGGGGGVGPTDGERKRLVLDPPKKDGGAGATTTTARSQSRPSPFGAARPREEVLAEKGLDWRKVDSEIETKLSRPTSSQSSRPSSAQSSRPSSPKVNPFGDAKPREVLLQERGMDWRKIDLELEHRGVDRQETDEEKLLKEEINNLKTQEENLKGDAVEVSSEELAGLQEQILLKERELEILIHQLDDKVRFVQRGSSNMRPSSGAGRSSGSLDARPHSRSGYPEESRSSDFPDRPRSRGGPPNAWSKSVDDRQGFQSGYFGDRNMDRPKSRERW